MKTRKLVPIGLFLACIVPVLAGIYRGSTILMDGEWALKFEATRVDRLPLFLHVICAGLYYPLGALQVLPGFRSRHAKWHRKAGGVAVATGLVAALSSVWMSVMHPEARGPILTSGRLIFGPLWALFLVLGVRAIVKRDFRSHGEWMVRAFAVAMPAGTLIVLVAPFAIVLGELPPVLDECIQAFAWVLHLGIAERLIRRKRNAVATARHGSGHRDRQQETKRPVGTAAPLSR
ncbi:MAG: DUF2306 domain-containing protein [Planctomycetota bacterium]|nr:DUF2306 domain-containing protein [Planctomycetota bacterium]